MPRERNGPNGISDFIVRLFLSRGKLRRGLIFLKKMARSEKTAPIQKESTTAESPIENPNKNPKTKMYLTSPKPNQVPLEIKKIKRNGRARIRPEIKLKNTAEKESEPAIIKNRLYRSDKTKRETKKASGIIKCLKS